jgi:hypothetical protein
VLAYLADRGGGDVGNDRDDDESRGHEVDSEVCPLTSS